MYTFSILFHFFTLAFLAGDGPNVQIKVRNDAGEKVVVYESSDTEMIKELKSCLKGRTAPNFKCGYTGKIIFTEEDGSTWDAEFNITSCNHIVFMKGDRLISRYLKKGSIELLKKLTKK